jgi:alpha-tubulin suppressor-like RCC1 family protein
MVLSSSRGHGGSLVIKGWMHRSSLCRALGLALAFCCVLVSFSDAHAWGASSGAFAWGEGTRGQLGDATTERSDVPTGVSGLRGVTAVSGGADFSLALLSDGTVAAWGENGFGELGNASTEMSDVPVPVRGLTGVKAIAAGGNHSLALLSNGTVMAWGYDAFGQLGYGGEGFEPISDVPVAVKGLSEVTAIAAGCNYSLALLRNGTVMAWGLNEAGSLGNGTTEQVWVPTPTPVVGLDEVTAITAGIGGDSMALLKNGTVMDWGFGQDGELGDGANESSAVPVLVSGLSAVVALPNGGGTMALLSNGTVVDWGLNSVGLLGDGEGGVQTSSDVPVEVSDLSGVTQIAGGFEHRLALLSDGKVMAWGNGADGMLGLGSEEGSDIPVEVSTLGEATSIATGQYFSLAAAVPRPVLSAISPSRGTPAGGTSVTLTGSNFSEVTAVKFGSDNAASFTVNSDTSITAVSPPGTGTVDVTVTTPEGTSAGISADQFTYGPTVTGVEPDYGSSAGGTSVTIDGSGFTGASAVDFGSSNAASFTVNSDTSISVVSPPGMGTVDMTVTTSSGTSPVSAADQFTYEAPANTGEAPAVESVSVSEISEHDATLEAQIDPNGLATTYQFRLGKGCYPAVCQVIVDIPLPVESLPGSEGEQTVKLDLNSVGVQLQPDSVYYYSVTATNAAGETGGNERIFRTPPEPMGENGGTGNGGAETGGASNISDTGATLNGVVTAWGWREATYVFEYGTSTSYGQSVPTPAGVIGGRVTCGLPCGPPHSEGFPVSENLTELAPDTTYHYRLASTSNGHTSYGKDDTFTTTSEGVIEPLKTTKPPKLGGGQNETPNTPSSGPATSTSTPAATTPPAALLKTAGPKVLFKAQKLAGALKACKKQSKRKRARCARQAARKYATTAAKKSEK